MLMFEKKHLINQIRKKLQPKASQCSLDSAKFPEVGSQIF